MPDARGHGESEGDYVGMGWHERKDIVAWCEELVARNASAQILLYGISMGGGTVMMVSGEALPSNVKLIVEDCGYSSVYDEFAYQLKEMFSLPAFLLIGFANIITKARAGYSLYEASAVEQVKMSSTPILFIHGGEDTFVPTNMVYEVYEAAVCEKELLVIGGAGHGMASVVAGSLYWETVDAFIARYMV